MTLPVVSRRWLDWGAPHQASTAHHGAPKGHGCRDAQDDEGSRHAKDTKAIILRVLHHAHAMGKACRDQQRPKRVEQPWPGVAPFRQDQQQHRKGHEFREIGMCPDGALQGGIAPGPERNPLGPPIANDAKAEPEEDQGQRQGPEGDDHGGRRSFWPWAGRVLAVHRRGKGVLRFGRCENKHSHSPPKPA